MTMEADLALTEHLRHMEERLMDPQVRKRPYEVAELLADGFVEFGSSGRVYDRAKIIDEMMSEPRVERTTSAFRAIWLAPDVALVTYRSERPAEPGAPPAVSLRSSIWKLVDGRWQMLFHQGTPERKP